MRQLISANILVFRARYFEDCELISSFIVTNTQARFKISESISVFTDGL